jgi:branched-chain amino acid transport system permease protein
MLLRIGEGLMIPITELAQQAVNGLVMGGVYALIALGLTLIFGILEQVNFAHGELYMVGAYATFYFSESLGGGYPLAIIFAMLAVAFLALFYEWLLFRPLRGRGHLPAIISSLGASIFLWNLGLKIFGSAPRQMRTGLSEVAVTFWGVTLTLQRLLVLVVALGLIICLYLVIMKTRMGRAMRATAQDPEVAALLGIDINRIAEVTFIIGGALAAAAGALIGPIFLIYPAMGLMACLKAFVVVILGGLGNVMGAVIAGFSLGVIESLGAGFIASAYKDFFAFLVLILVLWIRPEGFLGRTAKKAG